MNLNYNNKFMNNQQHNESLNTYDDLSLEDLKSKPVRVQVRFVRICNSEIIEKQSYSFEEESDARSCIEELAINETGLSLDFWEILYRDISEVYTLIDPEDIFGIKYRILIFPVTNNNIENK